MLKLFKKKTWSVAVSDKGPVTVPGVNRARVLRLAPNVGIHVAVDDVATDESAPIFEYQTEDVPVPAGRCVTILGAEEGHVWVTEVESE